MVENLYHLKNKEVSEHRSTYHMDVLFRNIITAIQDLPGMTYQDRDQLIVGISQARVSVSKYANEMYVMGKLHGATEEIQKSIHQ